MRSPDPAASRRVADVLVFEAFGGGHTSIHRHLLMHDDIHVTGVTPSTGLLTALAHLSPPDVVVVNEADVFALARAIREVRVELPDAALLAVHHVQGATAAAVLRLAGAHRALAFDRAVSELVPAIHELAASRFSHSL